MAIKEHGHTLEFLPPYSPDLNPIEKNGRKPKVSDVNLTMLQMNYFFTLNYDVLF
ncbi:hypothetical protein MHTCC0001_36090 [Flavobacteriaceae bacterium MHTCC 0001]